MRLTSLFAVLPLLTGCPTSRPYPGEFCEPDDKIVLTETDILPLWETSIAEHPLVIGSPFTGTLTWAADGSTTDVTITTSYRDVVIVGMSTAEDPDYECPAEVTFSMDITLETADGGLDEVLVANMYTPTWIDEDGTLKTAAVNDGIEGSLRSEFANDPRGEAYTDLRLVHPPSESVPTSGMVHVSFVVPENQPGYYDIAGEITFD